MRNQDPITVLLVEKDRDLRRVITASLDQIGFRVLEASDGQDALQILEKDNANILIIEHDGQHAKNTRVIGTFRARLREEAGMVLVTTRDRLDADWREQLNPIKVLYKPFDVRYLCRLVKNHEEKTSQANKEPIQ